jgi:hypothetical protein
MARVVGGLLLVGLSGCPDQERKGMQNVLAANGTAYCNIKLGERRTHVLLRCGNGCATGTIHEGRCPKPVSGTCVNECDVYSDVEICYAEGRVVSLQKLALGGDRLQPCWWPKP